MNYDKHKCNNVLRHREYNLMIEFLKKNTKHTDTTAQILSIRWISWYFSHFPSTAWNNISSETPL